MCGMPKYCSLRVLTWHCFVSYFIKRLLADVRLDLPVAGVHVSYHHLQLVLIRYEALNENNINISVRGQGLRLQVRQREC